MMVIRESPSEDEVDAGMMVHCDSDKDDEVKDNGIDNYRRVSIVIVMMEVLQESMASMLLLLSVVIIMMVVI